VGVDWCFSVGRTLDLVEDVTAVGVTAVVRGGGLNGLVVDGGVGLDGLEDGLVDDVDVVLLVVVLGSSLGHHGGGLGLLGGAGGLVLGGRGLLGSGVLRSLALLLVGVGGAGVGGGR